MCRPCSAVLEVCVDRARIMFRPCLTVLEVFFELAFDPTPVDYSFLLNESELLGQGIGFGFLNGFLVAKELTSDHNLCLGH